MRFFASIIIASAIATGAAARTPKADYPSCDVAGQRGLMAQVGGSIRDANHAHISLRANVLEADIGSARKGGRIDRAEADRLFAQVEKIRHASDGYTKRQGFLSAAERASYDRELDAIAMRKCSAKPMAARPVTHQQPRRPG